MRAKRAANAFLIVVTTFFAVPSWADEAPVQDGREAARAFATRGYELFEAGDYERAIDFFRQADERFHAPPHWLYIARAQHKQGKPLDAKRSYEKILAEPLASDAPDAFREAHEQAQLELGEITPRVPSIAVSLTGPGVVGATVKIDGQAVAHDKGPVELNPGKHSVVVEAPGIMPIEHAVDLKEGRSSRESFMILRPIERPSDTPLKVAFSIGGAGIGVGVAALAVSFAYPSETALPIIAIAGFAVGGGGLGTGAVLWLQRPSLETQKVTNEAPKAKKNEARIRAAIGPGGVSIGGVF